jgi:serine/threonine protein kinase/tetratricopeptide (TPR) repeat protein
MSEETLFSQAIQIADAAERQTFVDRECAGNTELRRELEQLLVAHYANSPLDHALPEGKRSYSDPDATFESRDLTSSQSSTQSFELMIGTLIGGKYKHMEQIGEGGMGSVFMAQQTEPVKRSVAVKVIKAGMDSKAVLARFDAERQALAMMDHPNIAKVLDGGLHEGRPYFVMELVKGTPITQYCDDRKLTPRQRLELFVPVCQAIQHAHQKGVIHRDIKPSNVLIALYDDKPVPKVIDFGVAKATGSSLTDQTLMTGFGAVIGTPEYMSPEQANLNNMDIDTRSDVYSLGVLLYELLTGTTPVDRKSLGKAALLEILRIVREVEAPLPSAKLSTIDTLPSLAANRSTEPAKLSKLMKGELDWVVLKALEKDRTRRYDTANALSRDIQRYLADEIVEARPPSTGYRLKKFVRRNRPQVIAASLVLLALLGGIAGTTYGLVEAKKQTGIARAEAIPKDEARQAEADRAEGERLAKLDAEARRQEAEAEKANAVKAAAAEKAASELARKNLAFAKKGNELLGSVFAGLDPEMIAESGRPLQDVLRENLVKAVKELDGSAIGEPLEVAAMQNTLGESLSGLGEAKLAIEVLGKAWNTRKAKLGLDHPDTLTNMDNLAGGYHAAGKLDKALPLLEEVLKLTKAKLGPDHPNTLTSMNNLAAGYQTVGQWDKALSLFEQTLKLQKVKLNPDDPEILYSMSNLANGYLSVGKLDKALPLFEQTLKLQKAKLGPEHPKTLLSMNNLAAGYEEAGQRNKALPLLEEALKLQKAKLGPDHPQTLLMMSNLATMYGKDGQQDKALPLLEETFKLTKAKLGPDHPNTLTSINNLAVGY